MHTHKVRSLEAIAIRLEAIASRLEAIAISLLVAVSVAFDFGGFCGFWLFGGLRGFVFVWFLIACLWWFSHGKV